MYDLGWFTWFAYIHEKFFDPIHFVPMFLPFHRMFAADFERVGQMFHPKFMLPYWDSARDFSDPAASQVFTSSYAGGNGRGNNCVVDGMQGQWTMGFPTKHCLQRIFNNGAKIKSWESPERISNILMTSTTYDSFRNNLEYGLHASIHNGIAGDMSSKHSPNDIFFFLHHSNMDRIWWKWQNIQAQNMYAYSGINKDGSAAKLSDKVTVYNDQLANTMKIGYGNLCYVYDGEVKPAKKRQEASEMLPEMNLASALSSQVLNEYFPLLLNGNIGAKATDLPPNFGQTSMDYINQHYSSSNSAASVQSAASAQKRIGKPKMPMPGRLSDAWLNMHDVDVNKYDTYYNTSVSFVNALNSQGYVSPYL
ncbi:Tyrosinase [Zancudomyces culisetae]|uniref:Tyrosinase n=1 Tax=Zancudomyces culisetae TaxID=1213189 RepID=A0A1R1PBT7_ZANCU|nr:Tyrosinase [Zancudomyces culisetae]|eukprot:OMH78437.1 Tyrosinase [Zancudomyces culisetae]